MIGARHTPGPWVTDTDGSFQTLIRQEDERGYGRRIATSWAGDANSKRRQGECPDAFYERSRKMHLERARENEANARLIAAAPDMLEALKSLRDECMGFVPQCAEQVDAAIAKAEGK